MPDGNHGLANKVSNIGCRCARERPTIYFQYAEGDGTGCSRRCGRYTVPSGANASDRFEICTESFKQDEADGAGSKAANRAAIRQSSGNSSDRR